MTLQSKENGDDFSEELPDGKIVRTPKCTIKSGTMHMYQIILK